MDLLERVWTEREEIVYPNLFGDLGPGMFVLEADLFREGFGVSDIDPRWLHHGVFRSPPSADRPSWAYLTSGLSNPWHDEMPTPDGVSGLGKELVFEMASATEWAVKRVAFALLACACYGADDWKPSRPGDIFRFTVVGRSRALDSIVLGRPWMSAGKYGARKGDTLNTLPADVFGGAEAIRVRRTSSGIVTGLEFDYGVDRDIGAILSAYEADLGAPAEVTVDSRAGEQRHTIVWRNADTEFRIIQFTPPRAGRVAAMAILSER